MPRGLPGVVKAPGQWTEAEYRQAIRANETVVGTKFSFKDLNRGRIETGDLALGQFGKPIKSLDQWRKEVEVLAAQYGEPCHLFLQQLSR